jgi:PAS fold
MRPFGAPETSLGGLSAETAGTLLSIANDITLVIDGQGVVRDLASGSDDLASETPADWIGQPWRDIVTPESRDKVDALLRDSVPNGSAPRWRHLNFVLPGGRELPLLFLAVKMGGNGHVLALGRDLRATAAL